MDKIKELEFEICRCSNDSKGKQKQKELRKELNILLNK